MKDETTDLERLGALLDERLAPDERAELLARLTVAEDERAVFADTAAVLRALEEEDAATVAAPVPPSLAMDAGSPATRPTTRLRRLPPWALGAIAAGIVLAVVLPLTLRSPRSPGLPSPEATFAAVTVRDTKLSGDWPEEWDAALRGEGTVADPGAMASRLGVAHLHLLLAVAEGDSSTKVRAVADAQELLRDEWALLGEEYRALGAPDVSLERIAETGDEATRTVGEDRFRLGAWAEAARLAATRRDGAFFRSRATKSALERAAQLSDLPPPAPAAVRELRGHLASPGPLDWPALASATSKLVEAITR